MNYTGVLSDTITVHMKPIVIKSATIALFLLVVIATAAITQSGTEPLFWSTSEQDTIPSNDIIDLGSAFSYPPSVGETQSSQAELPATPEMQAKPENGQALRSIESDDVQSPDIPILQSTESTSKVNPDIPLVHSETSSVAKQPNIILISVEDAREDKDDVFHAMSKDERSSKKFRKSASFSSAKNYKNRGVRFSSGNYMYIQVASFSDEALANQVAHSMATDVQHTYSLQVVKVRNLPLYRVLSGPIASEQLDTAMDIIKAKGYHQAFALSR